MREEIADRENLIICSSREIGLILKSGRRAPGKYVSVVYRHGREAAAIRVAFTTSKRIRRAVDRNRLKRLMRETFRLGLTRLRRILKKEECGIDLVICGIDRSPTISLKDVEKDFEGFLLRIDKEICR